MSSPKSLILWLSLSISLCFGAIPQWYAKPDDNHNIIAGVGSAKSLSDAKANALNDLASAINVIVQSQTTLKQERKNQKLDSSLAQNINLYIRDLQLLGVKVLQSQEDDGIFYVRMGIQKQDFIEQLYMQINQDLDKITALHLDRCQILDLSKFYILEKILQQTSHKTLILKALNHQTYTHPTLQKAYEILHHNSPKPDAHAIFNNLDSVLISALQKELTKFFTLKPASSSNLIIFNLDKDGLNITLKDCKGDIIFNDQIDASQLSRANFIFYKKIQDYLNKK